MTVGIFLHMDCVEDRSINSKKYSIIKVHYEGFYKLDQICLENWARL